ncbi:unnamed protein product [Nezara viridula]|uniref:DRBM domain-containing protein n=2 Tax=Nezara viridula TaxID=85310 RepID=A0A9P0HN98_NEZVI|nr:unnamed protein product [Nezara viridula]
MAEGNLKIEESLLGHVGLSRHTPSVRGGRPRMRSNTHNTRTIQPSEPIPLEEAAKRELQAMPTKTPVSMLQELLSRRGTTPKYELVQVEGAIHEPTFRYTVSVGETIGSSRFAAMGTGRSKKEAKHAAAKAILDKITGNTEPLDICSPASTTDSIGSNIGAVEERMMGNPIGLLQELCMTRRWPPPAYETENEEGLPHERQFTISCLVFRHKEIGTGKSKKIAKRLAAHKMWMRLKDLPCESNTIHYGLDDEDEINQRVPQSEFDSLKMVKIPTLASAPYNIKVSQFHKNLKSSVGPKLDELQIISLKDSDFNAVQFLQEIAAEQQFEVTFVDVEEKSVTGKCQSLVQLSTLPVAVCYGTGMSSSEAQTCAAYNALQYLKLMTKK